ncbi:RNA-binding protein [Pseudaestuariivita atlantica]|uniref:50S ribosomal protein L7 n=1 Tax=Pseudaestuariivita atlantica TaxID=1317121 RepID=A0A0L1JNJ5_9RHOB|nr:RNA-binding protein [Pseudaestuariivita atlantica]KNG93329.1 50S ribosomal protein L7 [Pseudaestuariivita atlantica]
MSRGGKSRDRTDGPERKCIVTGEVQPKSGLVRFVVSPDGTIVPDVAGKLPGRGMWVSATRDAVEKAASKGQFARAARSKVTVPDGLADLVEQALARRLIDLISMARKSGDAIAGYEKVKTALDKEEVKVLIQASDGSERGKGKLNTPRDGRWLGWLTSDELGLAFGRQAVIHAAIRSGGLSRRVIEEAQRLKGMRADVQSGANGGTARRKGQTD